MERLEGARWLRPVLCRGRGAPFLLQRPHHCWLACWPCTQAVPGRDLGAPRAWPRLALHHGLLAACSNIRHH